MPEDSEFEFVGTPLTILDDDEDDTLGKRKKQLRDIAAGKFVPVWKQEVTDEEGRRRFHGAFTGGFSAGYFNTVGTKEGWAPTNFVSSRKNKAAPAAARPEDFMDEEDKVVLGLKKKVVAKAEFEVASAPPPTSSDAPGSDLGFLPKDLISFKQDSIGYRLLKIMGWREGTGIGPKRTRKKARLKAPDSQTSAAEGDKSLAIIGTDESSKRKMYGPSVPTEMLAQLRAGESMEIAPNLEDDENEDTVLDLIALAPKDSKFVEPVPKTDHYGIGYEPHKDAPEFEKIKLDREKERLEEASVNPTKARMTFGLGTREVKGFGLGALEEADDYEVYSSESMAIYDIELGPMKKKKEAIKALPPPVEFQEEQRRRALQRCSDGTAPLKGFLLAEKPPAPPKWFPPQSVPKGYAPVHKFENPLPPEVLNRGAAPMFGRPISLTTEQRSIMLGEKQLPGKSVFAIMTAEDRDRLSRLLANPHSRTVNKALFQPFPSDPPRQKRYELFLEEITKGISPTTASSLFEELSEWEKQRELEDFTKTAVLYSKPVSAVISSRFTAVTDEPLSKLKPGLTISFVSSKDEAPVKPPPPPPAPVAPPPVEPLKPNPMIGRSCRVEEEWRPSRLVCKRFNVRDPHHGKLPVPDVKRGFTMADVGLMGLAGGNLLGPSAAEIERQPSPPPKPSSLFLPQPIQHTPVPQSFSSTREEYSQETSKSVKVDSDNEAEPDAANLMPEKPPIDLFKAIFSDSEEEDDEETAKKSGGKWSEVDSNKNGKAADASTKGDTTASLVRRPSTSTDTTTSHVRNRSRWDTSAPTTSLPPATNPPVTSKKRPDSEREAPNYIPLFSSADENRSSSKRKEEESMLQSRARKESANIQIPPALASLSGLKDLAGLLKKDLGKESSSSSSSSKTSDESDSDGSRERRRKRKHKKRKKEKRRKDEEEEPAASSSRDRRRDAIESDENGWKRKECRSDPDSGIDETRSRKDVKSHNDRRDDERKGFLPDRYEGDDRKKKRDWADKISSSNDVESDDGNGSGKKSDSRNFESSRDRYRADGRERANDRDGRGAHGRDEKRKYDTEREKKDGSSREERDNKKLARAEEGRDHRPKREVERSVGVEGGSKQVYEPKKAALTDAGPKTVVVKQVEIKVMSSISRVEQVFPSDTSSSKDSKPSSSSSSRKKASAADFM